MGKAQVVDSSDEADGIAEAYLARTAGNASAALRLAIRDALSDLAEADLRAAQAEREVSAGYVRASLLPVRGES